MKKVSHAYQVTKYYYNLIYLFLFFSLFILFNFILFCLYSLHCHTILQKTDLVSNALSLGQYIMIHFLSEDKITVQNSLFLKLHNAFNTNGFFSRCLSNVEACPLVKSATKASQNSAGHIEPSNEQQAAYIVQLNMAFLFTLWLL